MQLGDPPGTYAGPETGITTLNLSSTSADLSIFLNGGRNVVTDHGFGSSTISGVSGAATVIAANNDVYYGGAASLLFVGAGTAATVFGGSGNNTVFGNGANTHIVDSFGTGYNIFVDNGSAATVFGGGTGAVFGSSTGSTTMVLGNGNDVFVGGGGSDSIVGGNTNPTVFGSANGATNIMGSHAAFEIATGPNEVFNASLTDGGNNFFTFSSSGNATLVGAPNGTQDNFNVVSTAGGTAHTVTIENWHTGDGLFLSNYGAADVTTFDNAINGGASSVTLSDGTTISFQGTHPLHASGGVGF